MNAHAPMRIVSGAEVVPLRGVGDLAAAVIREHELALEAGQSALHHAIAAGEALLAAKQMVPQGEWIKWLEANVLAENRKLTTITWYMRMARHKHELFRASPATLQSARRLLEGASDSRIDPLVLSEVQRLRGLGRTYREISSQLGLTKAMVWRYANPDSYAKAKRKYYATSVAGKRALRREQQAEEVRRCGGPAADAYSLVRRSLQRLDQAMDATQDREARRHLNSAIDRLHGVEDQIALAIKVGSA